MTLRSLLAPLAARLAPRAARLAPLAAGLALAGCRSSDNRVDPEPARPAASLAVAPSVASLAVAPSAAPSAGPTASALAPTGPAPSGSTRVPEGPLALHRVAVVEPPSSGRTGRALRVHRVGGVMVVTLGSAQAWSLSEGRLVPVARWPGADPRLQATPSGRLEGGDILRVVGRFPDEYWATADAVIPQGPRYPSIKQLVTFHADHGVHGLDSPPVLAEPWGRGLLTVNDARRLRHVGPARDEPTLTRTVMAGGSERVRIEALATLPSGEVLVAGPDGEETDAVALERWRPGEGRGAVQRLPLRSRGRLRLQAAGAVAFVASWDASEWNQATTAGAGTLVRVEGATARAVLLPEWSTIQDMHAAADGTLWLLLDGGPRGLYRLAPGASSLQIIEFPPGFTAQGLFARDGRAVHVGGSLADVGSVILSTDPTPLLARP